MMAKRKRPAGRPPSGKEPAGGRPAPRAEEETSSVYERGQTVVPKKVRDALGIAYGSRLRWEIGEGEIRVVPVPRNPAQALRGILKGTGFTLEQLLQERRAERQREQELEERDLRQWRTSSTRPR
jgi:AbrB family looped-hinge helix DNA binding protein